MNTVQSSPLSRTARTVASLRALPGRLISPTSAEHHRAPRSSRLSTTMYRFARARNGRSRRNGVPVAMKLNGVPLPAGFAMMPGISR